MQQLKLKQSTETILAIEGMIFVILNADKINRSTCSYKNFIK